MFESSNRPRERYASVDRLTSAEPSSYGARSTGYASDVEVGSSKSYGSYGRAYGVKPAWEEKTSKQSDRLSRKDYAPSTSSYGSDYSRDYSSKYAPKKDYTSNRDYSSSRDYGSSKDYGSQRDYSSSSRDYGKSYGRSSKYGGGSFDFGVSYGANKPSYSSPTAKRSSDYVLTPFEHRRTTPSSKDASLTPFNQRLGRSTSQVDVSKPSYDRQSSIPTTPKAGSSENLRYQAQKAIIDQPQTAKPEKTKGRSKRDWEEEESSDSAHEPDKYEKRDPNIVFRTSRATSPMEPERDIFHVKKLAHKNRRRFISRTKTKSYPKTVYRRRRDRPVCDNKNLQIEAEEIDLAAGIKRYNRNKFREKLFENKQQKPTSNASVASRPSSGYSSYGNKQTVPASQSQPENQNISQTRHGENKQTRPKAQERREKVSIPKQSGFRPTQRPGHASHTETDSVLDDDRDIGTSEEELHEVWGYDAPAQTSYLSKQKEQKQKTAETEAPVATTQVLPLTPENLSLKESIEKVKSWKKQLYRTPPETPVPSEGPLSPGSKKVQRSRSRTSSTGSRGRRSSADTIHASRQDSGERFLSPEEVEEEEEHITQNGYPRDSKGHLPVQTGWKRPGTLHPSHAEQSNNLRAKKITFQQERSPSPYDNIDRSPSPYDNIQKEPPQIKIEKAQDYRKQKTMPAKSVESLASYGDVSSLASDDDFDLNRAQSMASLYTHSSNSLPRQSKWPNQARSMESLAKSTSVTSLPDIIAQNDGRKQGKYISSSIQDIDSFLDFTETEDDPSMWSEEDDENSSDPRLQRSHSHHSMPVNTRSMANLSERRYSQNDASVPPRKCNSEEILYISDLKNIDEFLGNEIVQTCQEYNKNQKDLRKNLSLNIPSQSNTQQLTSCESLLDTPVPETPDIPLSPSQVFAYPSQKGGRPQTKQNSKNLPLDQLGNLASPTKTPKSPKVYKRQTSKPDANLNLDDLDNILDALQQSKKSRRQKRGKPETFELFAREAKDDLKKESVEDVSCLSRQTSEDVLVDVDDVHLLSPEVAEFIPYSVGEFPEDYSSEAIRKAVRIETERGDIPIKDLLQICAKPKTVKPPWIEDEEERCFEGYKSLPEMLEDLGLDVKKV